MKASQDFRPLSPARIGRTLVSGHTFYQTANTGFARYRHSLMNTTLPAAWLEARENSEINVIFKSISG